jgi:chromodomain-helicase-DNA-binding protein 4
MDLQAIARAHRMGQKNPVIVYKLITKKAIEERIHDVANRKLKLDRLVTGNVSLSADEIKPEISAAVIEYGAKELFEKGDLNVEEIIAEGLIDDACFQKYMNREELIRKHEEEEAKIATNAATEAYALGFTKVCEFPIIL